MPKPLFNALACCVLLLTGPAFAAGGPSGGPTPPDLTAGGERPTSANLDWNLGATGARGWMHSHKMHMHATKQILITWVAKGSPADGRLEVGDVIVGVAGKAFETDPRDALGQALMQAETRRGGGKLDLRIWREGETKTVTLTIPVLGSYSATSPFNCQKTDRVIDNACQNLAKKMQDKGYRANPIVRSLNALGLLASGDDQYNELIQREANWAANFSSTSMQTWYYGYTMMFLSEYILATGDASVMPGLERQLKKAVEGQSAVGSWGHRFANEKGHLLGYGMMHAPGVPLTSSLVLARKAGAKHPDLDRAIDRSTTMIRFYVGKGAVPYGDHAAWIQNHDDNGKNGMAAVLFNLLGDREATEYFSHTSIACYGDERDTGHTGNFLNITWSLPGVAMSGPNATGAWMTEFGGAYYDLSRQWDGGFIHQGPAQYKRDSYRTWDTTGATLLALTIPRGNLHLTNPEKNVAPRLTKIQARSIIEDGRGWNNADRNAYYSQFTTQELIEKLTSWSPVVRDRAATALGRKAKAEEVMPKLIQMLDAKELETRYGVCTAITRLRGDRSNAIPKLMELFDSEDLWMRVKVAGIGDAARVAIPKLLERMAYPNAKEDPRGMEQRYLAKSLFARRGGLLSRSAEGIDREALMKAIRVGLKNQDGNARGNLASVYQTLSFEELRPLLPAIREAIEERPPSGIMFSNTIRMAGLDLFSKHHIDEGMDLLIWYAQHQRPHASEKRLPQIMSMLLRYGAHAQTKTEDLEALAKHFDGGEANYPKRLSQDKAKLVRETIEKIKQATDKPELIKIENIG